MIAGRWIRVPSSAPSKLARSMSIPSIRLFAATSLAPWLFTSASFAQTTTRGQAACAALQQLQVPGAALSDVKTAWSAAGAALPVRPSEPSSGAKLPAYCRLDAHPRPPHRRRRQELRHRLRAGAAGRLERALPLPGRRRPERHRWRRRSAGQAQGDPALARGFAVVTTDTGHQGQVLRRLASWPDQQASLDFAYQAVGRVAVLAKQIVAQHYGKPAGACLLHGLLDRWTRGHADGAALSDLFRRRRSSARRRCVPHFSGHRRRSGSRRCSTGRRRTTRRASPTRAARCRMPIKKTVIDGLARRLRRRRRRAATASSPIRRRAASIRGRSRARARRRTAASRRRRRTRIEKGFAGPKDSKGRQVYPGFLFDTGIAATQGIAGSARTAAQPRGPAVHGDRDGRRRAREAAAANPQSALTATSSWTNLNTFSSHGGKLIFYPRRQRPVVLGAGHGRLLRADDEGQRRRDAGARTGAGCSWRRAWATAAAARRRSTTSTCSARSSTGWRGRQRARQPSAPRDARCPAAAGRSAPTPARALQGHGRPRGRRTSSAERHRRTRTAFASTTIVPLSSVGAVCPHVPVWAPLFNNLQLNSRGEEKASCTR